MKKYFYLLFIVGVIFLTLSPIAAKNAYACDSTKGQITSVTSIVSYGDILTINGSGFGQRSLLQNGGNSRYDRWIEVFFNDSNYPGGGGVRGLSALLFGGMLNDYEQLPQNSKIVLWNDNKIEIKIIDDFEHSIGVQQAFNENVNKFSVLVVIDGNSPNANPQNDALVTEICGISDNTTFTYQPSCTASTWTCGEWGSCSSSGTQLRSCNLSFDCPLFPASSPTTSQSCTPSCISDSWSCDVWSACLTNGTQTRLCNKIYNCDGGTSTPITSQSCTYIPICASNLWSCTDWSKCIQNGSQTRSCTKNSICQGGVSAPSTTQSCTYIPACLSFNYSSWTVCGSDGTQTRNIISKYPSNCDGGEIPKTTQSCTYISTCTIDSWSCGDWGDCSTYGSQIRTCNKTVNCSGGTPPSTTQSCAYIPPCTADTWTCGDWNSCSSSGVQNRSCRMTFDCPSIITLPPIADQYCEPPNKPTTQNPPNGDDKISNQDTIIKATIKLMCLFDEQSGMQGSGTIIDASGLILTNKHVVSGTVGCLVGFINNLNDQPNYDARQIADIVKVSSTEDIAVLKLRNPNDQKLNYINITNGNSNIQLGTKINIYGYPAIFGKNITYTSGDFSGIDGSYLKTTAILEHGNSGGGAYLNNGTFIGIPSAVVKGELNALGYILSVNKINSWLGNTSNIISNNSDSNNYSRVSSVLDSISLKKLGNLQFLVAGSKSAETQSKTLSQIQKKSTIVESNNTTQKTNIEQNNQNATPLEIQQQKPSLFKRFINWITHFFK